MTGRPADGVAEQGQLQASLQSATFRRRATPRGHSRRNSGPILLANPGADLYGSDRMLLETVSSLVELGERVIVAVPNAGPLITEIARRGGETVIIPTPIIRKSALRPAGMGRLVRDTASAILPGLTLLRRLRPRVVVVNTITPPLWMALARALRIPVICHVHEAEASVARWLRVAVNLPLLLANGLIINSRFSRDVLVDSIPLLADRATVVYNTVPGPAEFKPARPEIQDRIRLLYVGRLSPRKGADVVLRAVRTLTEQGVDVQLDLVGAVFSGYEWYEDQLRAYVADHGLADRVCFRGFRSDVWPHLEAADICLVPSTTDEPFGNTAVEAALAGRPLIVSSTSGLLEASEGMQACVRVEPGLAHAIAAAVQTVVNDWPRYRELAVRDAEHASARYSFAGYQAAMSKALATNLTLRKFGVPGHDQADH